MTPVMHLNTPLSYYNGNKGMKTRGLEIVADWRPLNWMRLEGSYTRLRYLANPWDGLNIDYVGTSPRHQYALRWQIDVTTKAQVDLWLRRVDKLKASSREVPAYTSLDLRIGYAVNKQLDLSLVGQNLLDRRHNEFAEWDSTTAYYVPRSIFAKATWKF